MGGDSTLQSAGACIESPVRGGRRSCRRGHGLIGRGRVTLAIIGEALKLEALAGSAFGSGVRSGRANLLVAILNVKRDDRFEKRDQERVVHKLMNDMTGLV